MSRPDYFENSQDEDLNKLSHKLNGLYSIASGNIGEFSQDEILRELLMQRQESIKLKESLEYLIGGK